SVGNELLASREDLDLGPRIRHRMQLVERRRDFSEMRFGAKWQEYSRRPANPTRYLCGVTEASDPAHLVFDCRSDARIVDVDIDRNDIAQQHARTMVREFMLAAGTERERLPL